MLFELITRMNVICIFLRATPRVWILSISEIVYFLLLHWENAARTARIGTRSCSSMYGRVGITSFHRTLSFQGPDALKEGQPSQA